MLGTKKVNRIVSLAPSNTEILYALGLQDKLVGVTRFCDYPSGAKDKKMVGGVLITLGIKIALSER